MGPDDSPYAGDLFYLPFWGSGSTTMGTRAGSTNCRLRQVLEVRCPAPLLTTRRLDPNMVEFVLLQRQLLTALTDLVLCLSASNLELQADFTRLNSLLDLSLSLRFVFAHSESFGGSIWMTRSTLLVFP